MEKLQIVEVTEQLNHAGTKATADIAVIAERLGFKRVNVKMDTVVESTIGKVRRQIGYYRDWKNAEQVIPNGAILLLQHPFHYKQLTRDMTLRKIKSKGVKIISIVHDVEELRAFRFNEYYRHEFDVMIELADVIIVHNDVMKKWFIKKGIDEKKIISLGIFDYLQEINLDKDIQFEKSITIAGNLDTTKCGYIAQLGKIKNVRVNLYGPNFNENLKKCKNIVYHGSFPVDEIPEKLNKGFGLVWDGESIDGCKGDSGQYLKYNNPHKLSLYLSSGLPVIIWKEAAEAKFVDKYGVGILIDCVTDVAERLNNLTNKEWESFISNVNLIKKKLANGFFAHNAINKAIDIISKENL